MDAMPMIARCMIYQPQGTEGDSAVDDELMEEGPVRADEGCGCSTRPPREPVIPPPGFRGAPNLVLCNGHFHQHVLQLRID